MSNFCSARRRLFTAEFLPPLSDWRKPCQSLAGRWVRQACSHLLPPAIWLPPAIPAAARPADIDVRHFLQVGLFDVIQIFHLPLQPAIHPLFCRSGSDVAGSLISASASSARRCRRGRHRTCPNWRWRRGEAGETLERFSQVTDRRMFFAILISSCRGCVQGAYNGKQTKFQHFTFGNLSRSCC